MSEQFTTTALQQLSQLYVMRGWKIENMAPGQAVFSRQDDMGDFWVIAGVIGLFFGLLPGILILAIGYLSRKTHRRYVNEQEAVQVLARFHDQQR